MNQGYIVTPAEEVHLAALADAGDASAAFALSEAFSIGTPDYPKYRHWLQRSAELGHVIGQYNFGYCLMREGLFVESRRWLEEARSHAQRSGDTMTHRFAEGLLIELSDAERKLASRTPLPSAPSLDRTPQQRR